MKRFLPLILFCTLSIAPYGSWSAAAESAPAPQRVVVHLSRGTSDLHAAFMALKVAHGMQEKGAQVTLLLDLEGVRVADARQPNDLRWGGSEPLATFYDGFVKSGGKVLVCPHCAGAIGLDSKSLRPGAHIAADVGELAAALIAAEKVVDY